ncbi:MAG: nicotinate (nicotinamide) nucleotide adenylyltransferase [Anaerolineales bacterium]|nr:MAG: nicotinate (nicotinamide) nucleotide adenylyltransferase [Anaerolineales bacterium]
MARLIGVLGGTFDPPHIGHLTLADTGRSSLGLQRVLWVVTALPPHKSAEPITPAEDRVAMVQAAIGDDPYFELSWADINRPGPQFAIDTLRWLAERRQGDDFVYLMGADSINDLPTWHNPKGFLEVCTKLGVMQRPGVVVDMQALEVDLPGISSKVHFFDAPLIECSAHDIRCRVRKGEPFRHLVPPGVAEIIVNTGLYR